MKCSTAILLFFTVLGSALSAQTMGYRNAELTVDERVADLLSRMSTEEKVAQMRIFHAQLGIELDAEDQLELSDDVKERLRYGIAGIKNPGEHYSPLRAARLNNDLQRYIIEHNRWGIPGLFVTESYNGVDAEGCTKFGRPITLAASFDPSLVHRVWDVVGREARLRGMHMCHSPEGDLVRDPRFGRMSEAWGEDTYLTTEMVVSAVRGVQGDYEGLGGGTHIGAVTKHYAGYGQVLGGTNFAAVEISPRTLADEVLPPFQAAVTRGRSLGIMASHGDLNGIASHANPELLTGILRGQWEFPGYVVSDANDIGRLYYFMKVAESPEAAARMALKAGVDVDLYADDAYSLLPKMVAEEPELMKYIDQAAGRVLRTKFVLGLFDQPYINLAEVESGVRSEASLALAREADLSSLILLKNEGVLPLSTDQKLKVALLGPLVGAETANAFQEVAGSNVSVVADPGFQLTDEGRSVPKLRSVPDSDVKRLVKLAKKSDVVVLFLGGDNFTAKEAFFNGALGDRADLHPLGPQDELIRRVKALGKPVVVVLKHRRTLAINTIAAEADAILDAWDLSEFGDHSVARILFGLENPSGKLPVTVPRSVGQLPFHYSGKEINNKKGYLFMESGPLFPFGFGLSYTNFTYQNAKISQSDLYPGESLTVSVEVQNTGSRDGRETVQLYVKDEIGSVVRPDRELKGMEKITLAAGESKRVSFQITTDMLQFTRLDGRRGLESGDYRVFLGPSSAEGEQLTFRLIVDTLHPRTILPAMKAALRWQEAHPIYAKDPTDWTNGAYYTGVVRAHESTQDSLFLDAALDMGKRNDWQPWERFYHADDLAICYAYLYLLDHYPQRVNLKPTERIIEEHLYKPHPWREGIPGRDQRMLWWWCDALFMAPPVIAEYAAIEGDSKYLEAMHHYYQQTYDTLFDQEEHLFARDVRYLWDGDENDRKEANGKKIFWSRGNGWVLGGLAMLLEVLPKDDEKRPFYLGLYRKMAAKIKSIQPEDGLWRTSLLSPESYDHGEVSGSGFYTFALTWGINNGILSEKEYRPAVEKAWRGLAACQQADGMVGWVQNIGADPQPASADSWQNFGTGAFLLAASEILKLD